MSVDELIKITLNGKPAELKAGLTVTDLLAKWKMKPELVTVEVNEEILQKLDYETTVIKNGDHVEFVFYMGGGSSAGVTPKKSPAGGRTRALLPAPTEDSNERI